MKHCVTFFILFFTVLVWESSTAQDDSFSQYYLPMFGTEKVCHGDFMYGLKATSANISEFSFINFRPYTISYKCSGNAYPVNPPLKVMIGFWGFQPSVVSSVTELFTVPSDSTSVLCVHNLLSDLLTKKRMQFDYRDVKKVKLAIYNLNVEKNLAKSMMDKLIIAPGANQIIFIVWDQSVESSMPVDFADTKPYIMDVLSPVKIKQQVAPASSPAATQAVAPATAAAVTPAVTQATAPSVPPSASVSATPAAIKTQPASTEKAQPESKPVPKENSVRDSALAVKAKPPPSAPSTAAKRTVLPELNPLIDEFLAKKNIDPEKAEITYALSSKNDTLKITVSQEEKVKEFFIAIPMYPPLTVNLVQPNETRRKADQDIEFKDIAGKYLKQLHFKYFSQELFFDTVNSTLYLPKSFAPLSNIHVTGYENAGMKIVADESGTPKFVNITIRIQKTPIRFTVLDKGTQQPINNLDISILYNNKDVYTGTYNSGTELANLLYSAPGIRYRVLISNPDYSPIPAFFITELSFKKDQTFSTTYKPAFNFIYVDMNMGDRMLLKNALKEKMTNVFNQNLPVLMFVSMGPNPIIIKDKAGFNDLLVKFGQLIPSEPNTAMEKQQITNLLPLDSLAKVEIIKFQYFLSANTFNSSTGKLVDEMYTDALMYFSNIKRKKPEVHLYIDFVIPEDKKNQDYKYHIISN